ncbi:hypothetical protein V492_03956 [Pseudogymnoascus sp. VKM F-4246]|nr:hypothetical protein V492_03956 [Pseudogymnoascus sp. VKM F-4246]
MMTVLRRQVTQPSTALQSTPTLFNMDDMRFFQHFILNAYPHLPVNNSQVWIQNVPAFSHNYDYLMHAMLGLAATHLTSVSNVDYSEAALSHRVRAIQGFNKALSKKPEKEPDGDALLATMYSLTFQSAFMSDSLIEFLIMVRGCVMLSGQLESQSSIAFFVIDWYSHLRYMEPRLENLPFVDLTLAEGATVSLDALTFVTEDEVNGFYYHELVNVVNGIKTSSKLGYWRLVGIYNVVGMLSEERFAAFSNPNNMIGQILLAHFMALEVVLLPMLEREYDKTFPANQLINRCSWFDAIERSVSPEFQHFIQWPAEILNEAHTHKEQERRQLRRQPHNQRILSNLGIVSLPVPRRRNARTRHLDEEADDIAADKNPCQFTCREAVDAGQVAGQHGEAEARDQEVVAGADEDRGDDYEGALDGIRWLLGVEMLDGDGASGITPYFEQGADEDDPEPVTAVSDESLVALDE